MKEVVISHSEEETSQLGESIARRLSADAVVHLTGDLGAGKTALVRSIATSLGADERDVASPSFAITHEYPRNDAPTLIHIDCYRLSGKSHEWQEIGIPEMLRGEGVKFVEWPKEGFESIASSELHIAVRVLDDDSREFTLDWKD
jgi:tRNA threonylcarbamoyladenosine biosynthesis protein TsaE